MTRDRKKLVIQVAGDTVNTRLEPVGLPRVLRAAALHDLIDRLQPSDTEGLTEVRGAGPHELAQVVDAVFRHHFGLPTRYEATARVEA